MPDPMKIVVDVVNSERVKELTAEIQKQEKQILQWNAAMKGASATQQVVLQRQMEASGKTIANARREIAGLESASNNAGRGLGQLSYAIDDIQYGFNAIVNNIPQIVMGLGGSIGIAGAIGIVAVAVNQLIKHWTDLTSALQSAWEGGSAERLKVLAERAEEAAAAFEKLAKAPTEFEAKGKGMLERAVANEPAEKLRKEMTDVMMATGRAAPLPPVMAPSPAMGPGATPTPGRSLEQAQKEQYDATAKQAAELIGRATEGTGENRQAARDEINRMIKEIPGAFSEDFKKRFAESDPAIIKQREDEEKAAKAGQKSRETQHAADKAKEDDEKKIRKQIVERVKDEKEAKIRSLEDERTQVQKTQRDFDEQMWQKQHGMQQEAKFGEGAKSFIDYYKGASTGGDDPKALAKQAHEQRKKTNDLLQAIDDKLKKERRLVVPS